MSMEMLPWNELTPIVVYPSSEFSPPTDGALQAICKFISSHYRAVSPDGTWTLVIPVEVVHRAGISMGPDGEEFDIDSAIETVQEKAIDPSLN